MKTQHKDVTSRNTVTSLKKKAPRILALDFETSPAKGYFYGTIWETNIIEVIEYEQILCVAWKWHDEKKVHVIGQDDFKGYKPGTLNDKKLVEFFAPIFEQADIVSAHNGDRFDLTVFNTRLLAHGLKPVPPVKSFDTKKISKNKFHLPSNKLDDIADFLGLGRKLSTHKGLWFGCENGVKSDWNYMKKYCGKDVILQDDVLTRILPFSNQVINYNVIADTLHNCSNPTCGSTHLQRRGFRMTTTVKYQRFQCMDCGTWSSKPLKDNTRIR